MDDMVVQVHHGIFTNAYGDRGEGFRSFFLAPPWPEAEKARADRWLRGLRPLPGLDAAAGLAVNTFRLGGVIHACLAALDPEFARDEHGRGGGFLLHALLLPLPEDRPTGDFGSALLDLRRSFERPPMDDLERLESYIQQCKLKSHVALPAVDFERALALPEDLLLRLLQLSFAGSRSPETPWPEDECDDLPADLVRAASLLPPRLRLTLRWAYNLRPPTADTVFLRPQPRPNTRPPAAHGVPASYLEWLRENVRHGAFERLHAAVQGWHVSSWKHLEQEMRR